MHDVESVTSHDFQGAHRAHLNGAEKLRCRCIIDTKDIIKAEKGNLAWCSLPPRTQTVSVPNFWIEFFSPLHIREEFSEGEMIQ